jgi:hypothetical protein
MPDLKTTNAGHARLAAKRKVSGNSTDPVSGNTTWHWINGIADAIGHFFSTSIVDLARIVKDLGFDYLHAFRETIDAMMRIQFWVTRLVWHTVWGWVWRLKRQTRAQIHHTRLSLIRLLFVVSNQVLAVALKWVRAERRARIRDVNHARAQAKAEIRAMHHTVEREAASGYRVGQQDRLSLIQHLLDYAVARDPLLRDIVGRMSGLILDLLAVDDPPVRLLLGFLINHVIDRLGIDKSVGTAIRDLLDPILGKPKPDDIHDVIVDLSDRMLAMETQWGKFFTNGGAQVEQAGDFWRDITSPIGTAAIVAFSAQAITDPDKWAQEITSTVGRAANDVITGAAHLFREA